MHFIDTFETRSSWKPLRVHDFNKRNKTVDKKNNDVITTREKPILQQICKNFKFEFHVKFLHVLKGQTAIVISYKKVIFANQFLN